MAINLTRRNALKLGAATAVFAPSILRAQGAEINVGSLTPNTGGGGPFGPNITASHKRVADLVNGQGGVLGRQIRLYQENSETNPETAVRAADKLINVNGVVGILGTWSSSVTLGIMPKCQTAGVIQMCTSSSSDIPMADEKGLVFNFQALSPVWGDAIAKLAVTRGYGSYGLMALNNDFTKSMVDAFAAVVGADKVIKEPLYYNAAQASYRSEVTSLIEDEPDAVFIPSYVTDFTAVYKELYRQGYEGAVITTGLSVGPKFKEAVGDAADGVIHGLPVPPLESPAYGEYLKEAGLEDTGNVQHPFGTAGRDQMSTLLLAIEKAGTTDTAAVAKAIWQVTTGEGKRTVYNVTDGLAAIRAGEEINYSGASSSIEFDAEGMVLGRDFQLAEIRGGEDVVLERLKF
ncbi:ABC transporter substrate-binding protein [Paralimibaculum aggregatum]|uniref:ABC transporter substrate-binding protein n=1 Tax=Paralimibaculum aggregatum TaxID=3036245 RepID=A0ABQ6LLC9_9RHOB|nr:ABC transporter substrate-binding protein [Limibaculum sp. NKW23]GMG84004.1 ABC transporter substrate-binding protein [Limibaculum sp. NKW23]